MIDYFCDVGVGSASSQRCLYLVFEYMDTTVWQEFVRRKGLFDRQLCVRIFTDICRGTQHMHDLGIVHTDLSLPNLLYSHGRAKVADLGCSHSASTWALPIGKREKGTAHSRSPELWLASGKK
jgi:serine/threonine protein kinase